MIYKRKPKHVNDTKVRYSVYISRAMDDALETYCLKNGFAKGETIEKALNKLLISEGIDPNITLSKVIQEQEQKKRQEKLNNVRIKNESKEPVSYW